MGCQQVGSQDTGWVAGSMVVVVDNCWVVVDIAEVGIVVVDMMGNCLVVVR